MKTLVVYQSKSGYTQRYVQMLKDSVPCTLVELKALKVSTLKDFESLIYAGGVYAGRISGLQKFIKNAQDYLPQKFAVIAVGAAPPSEKVIEKLAQDNLSALTMKPQFFCLQGGFDPNKINFALKAMLGMVSKNLENKQKKDPASLTEEDHAFLEFFQNTNDQTSIEQVQPIIDYIRGL